MNKHEHIMHWFNSAQHDLETAESLFASSKYDWCLFIGHLVLEKALKALFVKNNNNKIPPKTHNLLKLAQQAHLLLKIDQEDFLDEVNDFNIEIRYPEYKKEFYKRCSKDYTDLKFKQIK